mmetsp:Transcript_24095/g.55888  ORF Transcript_24095/g.55888 Transcript_24095/m.55888 type:complete len:88 (+) Transcript_24095:2014-2277(+)
MVRASWARGLKSHACVVQMGQMSLRISKTSRAIKASKAGRLAAKKPQDRPTAEWAQWVLRQNEPAQLGMMTKHIFQDQRCPVVNLVS